MDQKQFEELLIRIGERRVVTKQTTFERHAQTVLVGIITLVIGWVGISIVGVQEKQYELITAQTVTAIKLEALTKTLEDQNAVYVRKVDYLPWKQRLDDHLREYERDNEG